jgi:hypothetical protein
MFIKFLPCDVNLISYCSVTSFKASGFYHYLNATLSTVAINLYYAYKGIFNTYIMIIFCTFNLQGQTPMELDQAQQTLNITFKK